eukprot:TRINITY_DN76746_c0_g1_i1.p1 TRINITY_DN76746_c0_g1~~TRINITY_DN76746_c0_g1_i1.p1  ORF type:complete len:515 (-),score=71.76 TRINITY_DN76746_c0_g1_i1:307-1740(-)
MKLSGATRKKLYQDEDGTLYVLMVIEKKEVAQEVDSFSEAYKEQLQKAKLSRENIEEGMKILGESIDELEENLNQGMKKLLLLLSVTLAFGSTLFESMDSFKQEHLESIEGHKQDAKNIVDSNLKYYHDIAQAAQEYYQGFLAKKWGEGNVKLSTNKVFTQYGDDFSSRESFDFENGKVTLEILSEKGSDISPEEFSKKLDEARGESIDEASKKDPVANITTKYMKEKKLIDTTKNSDKFLEEIVPKKQITKDDIKTKEITTKDGEKKKLSFVEVPMVPNHLKKLADRFDDDVQKQAKRFNVDPSHVFATIHTESYFNPMARSYVPAYGLMQIVPTTGGVDAYMALKGEKKILSPEYLYNPQNNIELGTQYIELIQSRYLKGVESKEKLFYCSSISYNAGIGNLYRALTGKKSAKTSAIKRINELEPQELYDLLRSSKRLTHEARSYIKKMSERKKLYLAYDLKEYQNKAVNFCLTL